MLKRHIKSMGYVHKNILSKGNSQKLIKNFDKALYILLSIFRLPVYDMSGAPLCI